MKLLKYSLVFFSFYLITPTAFAADSNKTKKVQFNLNDDGSHYIRLMGLGQYWLRYTDMNPGSMIYNTPVNQYTDMGIRRLRFHLLAQINDYVLFYAQFGLNNFGFNSQQFQGAFFHDALGEIKVIDDKLSIGGGLTAWSGLSRYSTLGVGSIMSLDAPLYQHTTAGLYDQFIRRFTIYGKGQIAKLDYRVGVSFPFASQVATAGYPAITFLNSSLSTLPPKPQLNGYLKYQLFEHESNKLPYNAGTYLGRKKMFTIGAGYTLQEAAIAELEVSGDTSYHTMVHLATDVFLDLPINREKMTALTWYAAYHYLYNGKNFVLNCGVMNPATGVNANASINGAGNAFPMRGTGNFFYTQLGYVFGQKIISKKGRLQPYVATQIVDFQALSEPMVMYESGINWFINGDHSSKLSFNVQQRPVYFLNANADAVVSHYRGMAQMQLQVSF